MPTTPFPIGPPPPSLIPHLPHLPHLYPIWVTLITPPLLPYRRGRVVVVVLPCEPCCPLQNYNVVINTAKFTPYHRRTIVVPSSPLVGFRGTKRLNPGLPIRKVTKKVVRSQSADQHLLLLLADHILSLELPTRPKRPKLRTLENCRPPGSEGTTTTTTTAAEQRLGREKYTTTTNTFVSIDLLYGLQGIAGTHNHCT